MNLLDYITLGAAGFIAFIVAHMWASAYVSRRASTIKGIPAVILFGLPFLVVADLIVRAAS